LIIHGGQGVLVIAYMKQLKVSVFITII